MSAKIFIVDDDPFWTAVLMQTLANAKYTNISSYTNGNDCINNLHQNPHIIFLDYQMENMNGLEVLEKVKNYNPNIGVVFCTAHEDLNVAVNAVQYNKCDYLLKENANKKEVLSIIRQLEKK